MPYYLGSSERKKLINDYTTIHVSAKKKNERTDQVSICMVLTSFLSDVLLINRNFFSEAEHYRSMSSVQNELFIDVSNRHVLFKLDSNLSGWTNLC